MSSYNLNLLTDEERRLVETTPEGGFLGQFSQWAAKRTDAPEYSLHSAGLMALSLACGDTMVLPNPFAAGHVYMNLYIIIVGPSTIMRKTTVLNYVMDLIPKNQQTKKHYVQVLDDVSTQAFNKAAADAGQLMSPLVFNVDEVAGLFEVVRRQNSYLKGLDKVLMKCYDHSPVHIKRTTSFIDAPRGAFTNVFAASTPEPLMEVLSGDDVESGLLPRFIIFDARDAVRGQRRSLMDRLESKDEWTEEADELRAFLYLIAKDRADGIPERIDELGLLHFPITEVPFARAAMERLDAVDAVFSKQAGTDDTAWGAIKGRAFWHIYKLSGLYAISRAGHEAEVELIDVLRAAHLVEATVGDLGTMKDEVGSSPMERTIVTVTELIRHTPQRQERIANELLLEDRNLKELRNTMASRGLIRVEKDERGIIYWRKKL